MAQIHLIWALEFYAAFINHLILPLPAMKDSKTNMTATQIPHWNLDQLYIIDSPELKADMQAMDEKIAGFSRWREKLAMTPPTVDEFKSLISDLEDLSLRAHKLSGFASLNFAQNTGDQKALAFMAAMDEKMAEMSNALLFFEIWWKKLPQRQALPLSESLPDFAYWLARARAFKPHTLAEAEEKIINFKNITGHESLVALFDSITNRYRFSTAFANDGDPKEVTRDELMVYVRSHEPEKRAGAYQELYRVFGHDGPILGQIYQTLVRDWRIENIRLRNYESPISVRNKANDLQPEAVEALLNTARNNASLFGDFFQLKAKALGLKKLRRYDIYAPLSEEKKVYGFDEACQMVLQAFENFSPEFKKLADNIISQNKFSALPQKGKQGGAFCCSLTPADTPWVLMTYNGRRQDLFTMAHELGHGIHSQLAARHNIFHFHATLPLAETASTFAEMLLSSQLLKNVSSGRQRADLLFNLIDDAYATVGRQAFFAMFEIQAHSMVEQGATVDELAVEYMANLTSQFGPELEIAEEFKWEWVSIPHFYHTPFYVYAYSFGQLLVYSLWRLYEKQGPDFVKRLSILLGKGGSAAPESILAESGLGPLNEDFWQGGFDVIKSFIQELKSALKDDA